MQEKRALFMVSPDLKSDVESICSIFLYPRVLALAFIWDFYPFLYAVITVYLSGTFRTIFFDLLLPKDFICPAYCNESFQSSIKKIIHIIM